jgi:leucyl-tRNA synthetase
MEWNDAGIEGVVRFLRRLWRVVHEIAERVPGDGDVPDTPLARKAHTTVAKVSDDIGRRFQFHTPIAAVMELTNDLVREPEDPAARFAAETAVSLIQPYAPHLAEELWERLGHGRLWETPWPEADPALLERDTFELVERAKSSPRVQAHLDGAEIRQTIVVPGKLVNIVTR